MSITDMDDALYAMVRLGGLESESLAVRPERCVRVRNRHASCRRCAAACTSGAIALEEDGRVAIDQALCVGCGTCATVCPTCALEIAHPNDAALLATARASARDGVAWFTCSRVSDGAAHAYGACQPARVVCLSRVEESIVCKLFAEGVQRVVCLHGCCEQCPRACGQASVQLVAQTLQTLIDVWGIPAHFDVMQVEAIDEVPPDAIDNAYAHPKAAQVHGANKLTHVQADGTLPHFVPARRAGLLNALAAFGTPQKTTVDTRLWGHITIDASRCQACRMCAVFCPTGALARYGENGEDYGIEHYPAECLHCLLCQDICPAHAITSSSSVPACVLAEGRVERYPMHEPVWQAGRAQIVRKMQMKIGGDSVAASYGE